MWRWGIVVTDAGEKGAFDFLFTVVGSWESFGIEGKRAIEVL